MIRALVVDNEELVRVALRQILESAEDIDAVGACDGPEALDAVRRLAPDVVLLDIDMPAEDGLSVLRRVRALPRPPAVAMLTALDTADHVQSALRAGAAGFLLKTSEPGLLVDSVRLLASGGVVCMPGASASVLSAAVSRHAGCGPVGAAAGAMTGTGGTSGTDGLGGLGGLGGLTEREREVITLVAAGLSNADIAAHLGMGVTTVKTHVGALKKKLGVVNRVGLATVVHRAAPAAPAA